VKIDPKPIPGLPDETRPVAATSRRAQNAGAARVESDSDALILSERADTYQRVRPRLDALPEAREGRLARIRELLARGEYVVDSQLIAEAMLSDEATAQVLGAGPAR